MKNIIKGILLMTIFSLILIQNLVLLNRISPVVAQATQINPLVQALVKTGLGSPSSKVLDAVGVASKQTGLSETFISALMFTESNFNPKAVSSKNYQGLMQIPHKVHYEDANCIIGSKIFLEKLKITGGDYKKAIILYKGWSTSDPEGHRQAQKVMDLAIRLKENIAKNKEKM